MRSAALSGLVAASLLAGLGPTPAGAQAPHAKLVRIPFPKYDGTLTPYTFDFGYGLLTLVYDTLLWRDANGIPRPWLARSVKRSNGDRRLTIRLREGVRWHDGRRLTAQDVAFTVRFVARRFHPRFTPQLANIERVEATDSSTVTIDLRRRSLGFDDQPLADLPILPRHLWEGLPGGRLAPSGPAVGSGPYRLVEAGRRGGYRFRANRRYFRGEPRVARIDVPIIGEENRTYAALRQGRVDMLPIPLPEVAAKRLGKGFDVTVRRGPSYSGTALLLNLRRPPFDRPAVRRAVASALDLGRILRNTGPGVPATRGYVHPASPWSSPAVLQRFDLPAARRTLARLGPRPIRVLAPNNDPVRLEAGRQVMLALRRAGAHAALGELAPQSLRKAIGEDGSRGNFDAAIVSTHPLASYDPLFLARLFGARRSEAPLNFSGYRSSAFEALADRVVGAPDRPTRRRAVAAELKLLARDLPAIPLFFSEAAFAYRPRVHDGWVFVRGTGLLDKRSFLRSRSTPRLRTGTEGGRDGEDEPGGSASALEVLSVVSLGMLVIALALAAAGLLSRWRARR